MDVTFEQTKITVGIPVYNVEKYIDKCLRSVLNQNFSESYEVLVIDDCGSDCSIEVVENIIKDHPKGNLVRIIHHEKNKGLGPSRNTAMDNAKGQYIFFLDSDDWISHDCLSVLYKKAIETNADAVVGSVKRVEDCSLRELGRNQYVDTIVKHDGAGAWMVNHKPDMHIEVWNKLYRTDFLRKNKICFVHRIFEDYYFDFRFRACAQTIVLCSEITLFYNIRQNSILTTLKATKGSDESVVTFCEILHYLRQMLKNEYSKVDCIWDLYFERMIWVMENFARYEYSQDQWKIIKANLGPFVSYVPNLDYLKNNRHRFIYDYCNGHDDVDRFYAANRKSLRHSLAKRVLNKGKSILKRIEMLRRAKNKLKRLRFGVTRFFNQTHRYDFPDENNGWKKVGCQPVYGDSTTGEIFDPFVFFEDNRFVMVASERRSGCLIRLDSQDGVVWSKTGCLLNNRKNSWESVVNRASIVNRNGVYHMWYTGQNKNVSKIGHAVSTDGKEFVRLSEFPVLEASMKSEGVSVMNPHVIWNEKKQKFQMWYAAGENYEPDVLFYAESSDGVFWEKNAEPVMTPYPAHKWECAKIGGCFVRVEDSGSYTMYYIGYQNVDVARICRATSKDGINWHRDDCNLCVSPSKNSWDSDAVYKPSVLSYDGKMYLWYNGRKDLQEYIGLAVKETVNEKV